MCKFCYVHSDVPYQRSCYRLLVRNFFSTLLSHSTVLFLRDENKTYSHLWWRTVQIRAAVNISVPHFQWQRLTSSASVVFLPICQSNNEKLDLIYFFTFNAAVVARCSCTMWPCGYNFECFARLLHVHSRLRYLLHITYVYSNVPGGMQVEFRMSVAWRESCRRMPSTCKHFGW